VKVLMLGWEFPPHISGGLGTACQGITRGLAARGVEVLFVVPRAHGDEQAEATKIVGASELAVSSALTPYLNRSAYAQRRGLMRGSDSYGPDLLAEVGRYALAAAEIARTHASDVIHAHDWMTIPAGIAAREATDRPLVLHMHACEYDRSGDAVDERVREIEARGIAEADRVVCVSQLTATQLERRYGAEPSKLRVVHNAVAQRKQRVPRRRTRKGSRIVLFLGRITYQKGPECFLEAAAHVVQVEPDVRFVMSGSGDLLPAMIELSAELGLARHISFTGFLRGAEVERMYRLADVYVMPSVSEPFGIAPLEAILQGKPVILSRQSGVCEVLQHALKFEPGDALDLADKILAVLHHCALSEMLVREGRKEVRALAWEDAGAKLLEVYEELVA
jgi:glycogen(starch) synthase